MTKTSFFEPCTVFLSMENLKWEFRTFNKSNSDADCILLALFESCCLFLCKNAGKYFSLCAFFIFPKGVMNSTYNNSKCVCCLIRRICSASEFLITLTSKGNEHATDACYQSDTTNDTLGNVSFQRHGTLLT